MSEDISNNPNASKDGLKSHERRLSSSDLAASYDRRDGKDLRKERTPIAFPERRRIEERRRKEPLRRPFRIPIFIKLATLFTLVILLVISAISYSMLKKQKEQFIEQLMDLGQSMIRIVADNAPDKLLGEEDLALFGLVNDIAETEQIVYADIIDGQGMVRAHSRINEAGKPYVPLKKTHIVEKEDGLIISRIVDEEEERLFFEAPITFQNLRVGEVHITISQKDLQENIRESTNSVLVLTGIILCLGVLLCLGLSAYFSSPIRKLGEMTKALGMGRFDHRVRINRNDEFGDLGSSFNRMAEDLEIKEKIKDSFGQYVTPEVVDMILNNPEMTNGSIIEATVLFVDIRGFTTLSEGKPPGLIVDLLNEYFTRVTEVVNKNKGHINKFAGDEAVAVFGAPLPHPHHALNAVKAALGIQQEMEKLNREKSMEDISLEAGVGINSGEMVAGSIGSEEKREYTVIGDSVNVSSRLTSLAKGGEILMSRQTYELIGKDKVMVEPQGEVSVKGRKEVVGVFRVLGLKEEQNGRTQ
ncbi:MAG: HAMP domain-containing protein [Deltaproteobacteria bacterium]|nr:HAMP domain-containing protein [Deltaproteobacteria bacterium]